MTDDKKDFAWTDVEELSSIGMLSQQALSLSTSATWPVQLHTANRANISCLVCDNSAIPHTSACHEVYETGSSHRHERHNDDDEVDDRN